MTCSVEGCEKDARVRGWCQMHYTRWCRHGDPLAVKQVHGDDALRMTSKYRKDSTGCWVWLGTITDKGYGQVRDGRRTRYAYKVMYEMHVGPVPAGHDLDHLCRNRACVNPAHLEPVTHQENLLRGRTIAARNAAVTHCPQGHEYTPENTYVRPTGGRHCRTCRRNRSRQATSMN